MAGSSSHDHRVSFYDHDAELVAGVAHYVSDGLRQGERVVVVATAPHRLALEASLLALGTDVARAQASNALLCLDADDTLATFMVDGVPDHQAFRSTVGRVIELAGADGCGVRVFGEMVALLWQHGNVAGALELEVLWNGLADHHAFNLRCAYPTTALDSAPLGDISRICDLHSEVGAPSSYLSGRPVDDYAPAHYSEVFIPAPEAVVAARRFVADLLCRWDEDELVPDATLVTSEIATNAVQHGDSAFRVRVERSAGAIRISVEDAEAGHAQLRSAAESDMGGRGVAIVEALATRWGSLTLPGGKAVWAELVAAGSRR